MKNDKNTKTAFDLSCLKKSFEIEVKIYNGEATVQEIDYIESFITNELPSPRLEYLLGLAYYLGIGRTYNPEKGELLFRDVFNRGNELVLIHLSLAYAYLGDEYAIQSIECLEKSSALGNLFAEKMLKDFDKHSFPFPKA